MIAQELLAEVLQRSLKKGGDFADIFLEESQGLTISCEDGKVERIISGIDQGLGLRIIQNFQTIYGCTNDLSKASLLELAETLSTAAGKAERGDLTINLTRSDPLPLPVLILPSDVSLERKVQVVKAAEEAARKFDQRIRQVRVTYRDSLRRITIANSEGTFLRFDKIGTLLVVQAVAADSRGIQTGLESVGGTLGFELFEESPPELVAEKAARRALRMLEARSAPAGRMPVVLSSEAGGTMIHEAVGHGLEADLAQDGLSVYSRRLGEQIASSLITVIDDATLPRKRGSFPADDEGIPAQRTVLIEKGILKSYLYDRLTAMKDGVRSTGNGRRESYQHKPIPRMTNTFIEKGQANPEDIVASTKNGLYVQSLSGGSVNPITGVFNFTCREAYLIENGRKTSPVRGATLVGSCLDIIQGIDAVGYDLDFGPGICGKGQSAEVTAGQPTVRIRGINVGGTRGR
ncbi:MAG: TldD/PmbA family protein [Candidatus Methylomirabilales bacterium]